jgi:hypothetical protein
MRKIAIVVFFACVLIVSVQAMRPRGKFKGHFRGRGRGSRGRGRGRFINGERVVYVPGYGQSNDQLVQHNEQGNPQPEYRQPEAQYVQQNNLGRGQQLGHEQQAVLYPQLPIHRAPQLMPGPGVEQQAHSSIVPLAIPAAAMMQVPQQSGTLPLVFHQPPPPPPPSQPQSAAFQVSQGQWHQSSNWQQPQQQSSNASCRAAAGSQPQPVDNELRGVAQPHHRRQMLREQQAAAPRCENQPGESGRGRRDEEQGRDRAEDRSNATHSRRRYRVRNAGMQTDEYVYTKTLSPIMAIVLW